MKWIYSVLALALTLVTVGMILILQRGVSIRTSPQIKPTAYMQETIQQQINENLYLRLFPEIQESDYLWLGADPIDSVYFEKLYQTANQRSPKAITLLKYPTEQLIRDCIKPCWFLVPPQDTSDLAGNPYLKEPEFSQSTTITMIHFNRDMNIREECLNQQRITFDCITEISMNEIKHKLKLTEPFFFMRKYLDKDFFFFVEDPKKSLSQ